jgi:hypothetical protein
LKARQKVLGSLVAGLAAAIALTTSVSPAGATNRATRVPVSSPGASLTRPYVSLGKSNLGERVRWGIIGYGREGRLPVRQQDRQSPCLEVEMEEIEGNDVFSVTGSGACYIGELTATNEPLIVVGRAPIGRKATTLSAIGMAFAPAATHLEVSYADGSTKTIPLRQMNPKQARKIGRMRFRYTAFTVKGLWCPTRLVSLDGTGQPLWEETEQGCFLHGAEEGQGAA